MPFERAFRVRHYECDAYGHLNNTTYLHYMAEVERETGDGGRPPHIDITYTAPVSFGDTVVVTAADADGGRKYDFRRDGDRVAVALATADVNAVPPPPPRPTQVFSHHRRIEWADVDASSTVSPAVLAGFAEDCGVALCRAYRWPLKRCWGEGFAMVVRRHEIEFPSVLVMGDEITIDTWASDRSRASAIRHYVLTRWGRVVARLRSHYVWVDATTMRPIRIPEFFLADFEANFSE